MRWWLRILVTLVLAPAIWQLGAVYLGSAQGGSPDALLSASLTSLPKLYLVYSLPALALIVVLLLPADRLLARLGGDLLIVAVAPVLAVLVPVALALATSNPRFDAAGVSWLAFVYGLVYGLTVREPLLSPAPRREVMQA